MHVLIVCSSKEICAYVSTVCWIAICEYFFCNISISWWADKSAVSLHKTVVWRHHIYNRVWSCTACWWWGSSIYMWREMTTLLCTFWMDVSILLYIPINQFLWYHSCHSCHHQDTPCHQEEPFSLQPVFSVEQMDTYGSQRTKLNCQNFHSTI